MSADDFTEWADELGDVEVRLGEVADVSTVQVGDHVLVTVAVPVPAGLDGEWMREALASSVGHASSVASAAARAILLTYFTAGMDE
jgi:hypothetical protein